MATKIAAAIEEGSPSPFGFNRTAINVLVEGYIDYCESVKGLSLRTVDRYHAALGHFKRFAAEYMPSTTVVRRQQQ